MQNVIFFALDLPSGFYWMKFSGKEDLHSILRILKVSECKASYSLLELGVHAFRAGARRWV